MLEQEIAKRLFAPKDPDEMPYILCRRYLNHKLTSVLHDYSWEGLRRVTRAGKTAFEVDRNFVLEIGLDGTCRIPKTKNNEIRLARLSKPIVTKATKRVYDYVTGEETEKEIDIVEPPTYERIEDSLVEQSLVDRLVEQVKERLQNPRQEPTYAMGEEAHPARPVPESERYIKPLPDIRPHQIEEEEAPPDVYVPEDEMRQAPAPAPAPKPKNKGGRPRKNPLPQ